MRPDGKASNEDSLKRKGLGVPNSGPEEYKGRVPCFSCLDAERRATKADGRDRLR